MLRYGSVCSGIEAATAAWHVLGWAPAFFAEIERFPSEVLAHHYGSNLPGEPLSQNGVPNYGDFTQIGADAAPVDILVGGTPCQSFSVAGKRLGLDDPRGNLALEYLSLACRLRARWIVWENVPGVVSSVTDEEDGDGDLRSGLDGREAGDEWIEESDFATFLSFVRECGYGFAYRVLDAQYVRVDGYERAVPQRRRRVFVVGYLGDWRRAAAVLLEPEGMRGDPAPRREAGQRATGTVAGGARVRGGYSHDDVPLTEAFGGGNTSGPIQAAACLTAKGQRVDFEVETFVAHPLLAKGSTSNQADRETYVAHSLRAEGFDASEDGTGRGTPIVAVPFDTTQITSPANRSVPKSGDPCHPLAAAAHRAGALGASSLQAQAVAFDLRGREGGALPEGPHDTANIRAASGGSSRSYIAQPWAVRRLTPTECERLQGYPDGYTNIPRGGGKAAADGPRYKAPGNSMAVNVMRWIGRRIEMVESITKGMDA